MLVRLRTCNKGKVVNINLCSCLTSFSKKTKGNLKSCRACALSCLFTSNSFDLSISQGVLPVFILNKSLCSEDEAQDSVVGQG